MMMRADQPQALAQAKETQALGQIHLVGRERGARSRSSRSEGPARKPRAVRGAPPRAMKRTRPHEEPKPQKPPPIPDLCAKEFGNHVTVRNDTGKRICVSLDNGQAWPWAVLAPDGVHEFTSQLPTPYCAFSVLPEQRGANVHLKGEKHAEGGQTLDADGSVYKVQNKTKKELEAIKIGENGTSDHKIPAES